MGPTGCFQSESYGQPIVKQFSPPSVIVDFVKVYQIPLAPDKYEQSLASFIEVKSMTTRGKFNQQDLAYIVLIPAA